jgi:Uri superfamily endonuclease
VTVNLSSSSRGTYILLLRVPEPSTVPIGRLGSLFFDRGRYAYVGSAFGPGGLAARLGRYATGPKRRHWHIDHLLTRALVTGALVSTRDSRMECRWAASLSQHAENTVPGFGSTDCTCPGHLFFLGTRNQASKTITSAVRTLKATLVTRGEIVNARRET